MSGNAKFKWFLLAPIVIALGSGCTTTPPPFGDPLDNMVAAQDKMSSLNISLGLIKSESVSIAINQINQIPGFVSSDDEDADASYLINNITQALKRRFKEIIFLDSVQELKHMNVDVGIILDLQVIFGRLAFQTTSVQINGTLIDEAGQEILRIASRGSKTIPFGSLDHGFKTATNKALKQFTETIDSDKFQASLSGIAETVAHRNREKQKSKEMILTKLIPMNAKFRIVEPSAKVRQAPFNQSRVVKKISMGSILQIIGKLPSGWMQVAKEGESIGWIHGDSVALDSTVPPSSRQQQARTIKEPTPQSGTGSGFFVSKMGHIITNAHVVQNCKKVTIGDNANKQVPAEVVNKDKSNDLALLKLSTLEMASAESKSLIQKLSIVVVPLASKGLLRSDDVKLGEKILVAGYPFGEYFSNTIKVTGGLVSATRGVGDDSGQFQLDAAVQPGNSGGPIYDSSGNIVGVVISQLDKLKVAKAIGSLPENVNFGIKASTVRQFLISSGVPSKKSERTEEKSTEQLAEIAKNQALMVMCLQ